MSTFRRMAVPGQNRERDENALVAPYKKTAARKRTHIPYRGVIAVKALATVLLAIVALSASTGLAQPSADAKARGKFDFYGRGAGRAMRGARESVGSFREYVRGVQPAPGPVVGGEVVVREVPGVVVSPQIAQTAADEIGDYIMKSEKHLAWMRRQAEARQDTDTLASLDSIDRNLAEAKRNHATLCSCCLEDTVDAKTAMACCQTIDDALGKAISEHDALMKRLAEKQPGAK